MQLRVSIQQKPMSSPTDVWPFSDSATLAIAGLAMLYGGLVSGFFLAVWTRGGCQ